MIKKGSFFFFLGPCLKLLFVVLHVSTIMAHIDRRTIPNLADWSTVTRLFGVLIPNPIQWLIDETIRRNTLKQGSKKGQ